MKIGQDFLYTQYVTKNIKFNYNNHDIPTIVQIQKELRKVSN